MSPRALVVEDAIDVALGLRLHLEADGLEVEWAGDARAGLLLAREQRFDLILLDLDLDGEGGRAFIDGLERAGVTAPVLVMAMHPSEPVALEDDGVEVAGALVKPFSTVQLVTRVRSILSRGGLTVGGVLDLGPVRLHLDDRVAVRDGRRIPLTGIEASVLRYLGERLGRAVPRSQILRDLWGLSSHRTTRTIDNHVLRIRRKIEADPASPALLLTVHGSGYRLASAEDPPGS